MAELVHRLLERNALKYPQMEALIDPAAGVRWSWQELDRLATGAAQHLAKAGVKRGDRVVIFMPNRPEFAVAYFGTLKAGGAAVPVNPRFTPSELAHILQDSEAAAIAYDPALEPVVRAALAKVGAEAAGLAAPALLAASSGSLPLPDDLSAADMAELIYTSGTTGTPKGAVLSHGAVYATASMFAYEMEIRHGDRVLSLMPLTHSAVLNLTFAGAAWAGATNVIGNYAPQLLPQYIQEERCTHFFGAPVAYLLSAKLPNFREYDLRSIKRLMYGGAPMSREQVLSVQQAFGPKLNAVYGLTEAGPNGTALFMEDHPEKAGSIGKRATVNTEIKVVRPDGTETDPDEVGEIVLRSASVMNGYWRNEAATKETLRDGWIWTGDLGRRDADDYIYVIDRKKDMVITGGVNVYPKEVEEVLSAHPAVEECAVFGVPHPEWGESVMAALVPKAGSEVDPADLEAHCARHLARFKVPRGYHLVPALPRNSNGKILKHVLRQQFVQA